ncbi:related to Mitochondrial inner membrane magnesium transporter LPE10 [Saccharomycodes ludwigii]|uniref:Magnesium transporter n=1 Tax=Saccharomycodes ludwigii TaxID=36035 RepID=A0A376B436_9ASCO|nr:hypothetical protein SCDLUD_001996 [Saccharomycodes ludwigii]KAH3902181.1 hypothetical protein SCDLUD_001996 [Saccharomycodes ludwigii]SSD59437.1 related to Mitochondrial inner membrane magnesium transporter LPE10 [Saccharomycodes ludwigii]
MILSTILTCSNKSLLKKIFTIAGTRLNTNLLRKRWVSKSTRTYNNGLNNNVNNIPLYKLPNTPKQYLRCTIFNERGEIEEFNTEFSKDELCSQHHLYPRDLRKLNSRTSTETSSNINTSITAESHTTSTSYNISNKLIGDMLVPSCIVRDDSILLNILDISCLIKSNMVILFEQKDYKNPNIKEYDLYKHSNLINELSIKLRSTNTSTNNINNATKKAGTNSNKASDSQEQQMLYTTLPYEFRALEAIFTQCIKNLARDMNILLQSSSSILNDLEYSINRIKLQKLLMQNKVLFAFYKKSILCRDMIDDLLDQDDLLSEMYLTVARKATDDHEEIEMLLENYYSHVDEVVQTVENSLNSIKTTEEIINIILDSNRNQLMLLGLRFTIGLLSLGGGLFVASLYGMNLENFIEHTDLGFYSVCTVAIIIISFLFVFSIKSLNSLEKITMMGHQQKQIKTLNSGKTKA